MDLSEPELAAGLELVGMMLPGIVVGALGAAVVARVVVRRQSRRASEAQRRARAAERMAELGAMTGGLAHEIKNPLSTIGLNAQLLDEAIGEIQADEEEKSRLSRRITVLRREIDRLAGILNDFLQFAGQLHLDRKNADLNVVVDEMVDFFHPQAAKAGVRLRADTAANPLDVPIDVPQVKQAVLNLMLNAVHAMASQLGRDEHVPKELILKTATGHDARGEPVVLLHVIDTGPGMDEQIVSKVFQPYFTTKTGGSGLGLPTTRRIVEAHAGHIDIHTELGRGTDFVLTFPVNISDE